MGPSQVIDRVSSTLGFKDMLSTTRMTMPPMMNASATGTAWKRTPLMYFWNASPSTAAGMKAMTRFL